MEKERIRVTTLVVLFGLTLVGVHAGETRRLSQKRLPDWSAVPYEIDGWSGTEAQFDPIYGSDPAQTSILRIYRQSQDSNSPVIAYVGFFGDLPTILEVHTPEVCYPSQGWRILSSKKSAGATFRGSKVPEQQIVVEKGGQRRLVAWWYNAGPRAFETRIRYVLATSLLSTLTGRTDGSMVRLETPLEAGGEAAAIERIDEFRSGFLIRLEKALPR